MLNPRAPAPNTPRRQTAQITATLPMGILRQGERAVKGRAGGATLAGPSRNVGDGLARGDGRRPGTAEERARGRSGFETEGVRLRA